MPNLERASHSFPRTARFDSRRWMGAALFAAVLILFWPAVRGGYFPIDDARNTSGNPSVLSGLGLRNAAWALTTRSREFYEPATWLSLQLDASLFGGEPRGFHFTSVLLHAVNACLLFEVLCAWGCGEWASLAAAALFAAHPLRVESVAWITERRGLLSCFFLLLFLRQYDRVARGRGGSRALATGFFALAALSKPVVLVLPAALLAVDACVYGRAARGRALVGLAAEKWPLWLIAVVVGAVTVSAQAPNMAPVHAIPWLARLVDPIAALRAELVKAVVWRPMSVLDALLGAARDTNYSPQRAAALAGGAAAAALSLYGLRRAWPEGWGGGAWLAVMTVPILGFFRHALTVVPDRYTYLPHLGLAWALAGLMGRAARGRPAVGRVLGAAVLLGLVACAADVRAELVLWTEPLARAEFAARTAPESAWASDELGAELLRAGRAPEAEAALRDATRRQPSDARALNNLGLAVAAQGRRAEGAALCARAQALGGGTPAALNAAALRAPPRDEPLIIMTGAGPIDDTPPR